MRNVALGRVVWARVMWPWTGGVDTSNVTLDRRVWMRVMWLWTGGLDKTSMAENGPLTSHLKSAMNCRVYKSLVKEGGGGGVGSMQI
jgi:hypothetical protein